MHNQAEIIAGLKNGQEAAVAVVINLYGDCLLRTAMAITGDRQAAEEVVQDTFLQGCRKIKSFRAESSLQTWLLRITVNLARNRLRSGWLRRVTCLEAAEAGLIPASATAEPEARALSRERRQEVIYCLQKLPVKYREVLVLYYLEELSLKEMVQVLGQPEGTLKSKLSRGRALLKDEILARGVIF
jgi:RNA polymerase sigma-70 factor (ECF subfamily)